MHHKIFIFRKPTSIADDPAIKDSGFRPEEIEIEKPQDGFRNEEFHKTKKIQRRSPADNPLRSIMSSMMNRGGTRVTLPSTVTPRPLPILSDIDDIVLGLGVGGILDF